MIVVTGKSGVGKTWALKKLQPDNVIDMDKVVKNMMYKSPHLAFRQVKSVFGSQVLSEDKKSIDTQKLGQIVLTNKKALNKLNSIMIFHIKSYIKTLPDNSIVELAIYMNHEHEFKALFSRVIFITGKINLQDKFNYLINKSNPILEKSFKFDFKINNHDKDWLKKLLNALVYE